MPTGLFADKQGFEMDELKRGARLLRTAIILQQMQTFTRASPRRAQSSHGSRSWRVQIGLTGKEGDRERRGIKEPHPSVLAIPYPW